jgi:transmembrane sensor
MAADRSGSRVRPGQAAIAEGAARWLARRDRGLTPAEADELRRWESADPRHADELARLEQSWREFDGAKLSPELRAMTAELERGVARRNRRRTLVWRSALAAAASVALFAGAGGWRATDESRLPASSVTTYRVIESTARRVTFEDGSFAEVRGESEVQARFTAGERRVHLLRGEAHFTVMPSVERPFLVIAGESVVRAVGTAFNVRLETEQVEVLVTEGTVKVTESPLNAGDDRLSPLVVAGQRALVTRAAASDLPSKVEVSPAAPAEVEQALAWQSKRLVFDRTPLQEAVDAFNAHAVAGSGIRVMLGDDSLRERRLGGTFRAANAEAFVRLLEQSVEVRADRQPDRVVLYPAR